MSTRIVHALAASAVLTGATALAQESGRTSRAIETDDTPITVVGCVQRESDYRTMNDAGRGGVLGTGLGRGNEYVLVDSAGDCGTLAPGAAAYELTGTGEKELAEFAGRRVEVTGTLKGADLTVDGRAEGGFDPIGQDLRLREVEVASFRESGVMLAQNGSSIGTADDDSVPVGTSGEQEAVDERLPRTASPLALAGLLGLLSAGGGLGLRKLRNLIGR